MILLMDIDFGALAKVIFFIIAGLVWVLNRISAAREEAAKKRRAAEARQPRRDVGLPEVQRMPEMQRAPDEAKANPLGDEIAEFLKRAAGKSGQAGQGPVAAPPATKPRQQQPQRNKQKQPKAPKPQTQSRDRFPPTMAPQPRVAPVNPGQPPIRRSESVDEYVKTHLEPDRFANRASHLTKVDKADEQMEQHLQQVFHHQVGSLRPSTIDTTADQPPQGSGAQPQGASALLALLNDPSGMRNAIVLSEILQRPEHRW